MQPPFGMGFRRMLDQTFNSGPMFELVETMRVIGIPVSSSGLLLNKLKSLGFKKYVKNLSLEKRSIILSEIRAFGVNVSYFGTAPCAAKEHLIDDDLRIIRTIWTQNVPEVSTDIIDRGLRELKTVLMTM